MTASGGHCFGVASAGDGADGTTVLAVVALRLRCIIIAPGPGIPVTWSTAVGICAVESTAFVSVSATVVAAAASTDRLDVESTAAGEGTTGNLKIYSSSVGQRQPSSNRFLRGITSSSPARF